jgi:hypothetical protein
MFVCPCGPPRPGRRARRVTRRRAPDGGFHTGSAFSQAERAMDVLHYQHPDVY